jgi:hypothetical protein
MACDQSTLFNTYKCTKEVEDIRNVYKILVAA